MPSQPRGQRETHALGQGDLHEPHFGGAPPVLGAVLVQPPRKVLGEAVLAVAGPDEGAIVEDGGEVPQDRAAVPGHLEAVPPRALLLAGLDLELVALEEGPADDEPGDPAIRGHVTRLDLDLLAAHDPEVTAIEKRVPAGN